MNIKMKKDKKLKYHFETIEHIPADNYCHYSDLPSPSAYKDDYVDYDGMGNQGRFPKKKINKTNKMKRFLSNLKFSILYILASLAGYFKHD